MESDTLQQDTEETKKAALHQDRYLVKFPVGKESLVAPSNFHSCHISYIVILEVYCVCTVRKKLKTTRFVHVTLVYCWMIDARAVPSARHNTQPYHSYLYFLATIIQLLD